MKPEIRAMFDSVYDFFYGDQLRKHVVLIGAFFLGQVLTLPLLAWLGPSQYVTLAVTISLIATGPLVLLYDKLHATKQEHSKSTHHVPSAEGEPPKNVDFFAGSGRDVHGLDLSGRDFPRHTAFGQCSANSQPYLPSVFYNFPFGRYSTNEAQVHALLFHFDEHIIRTLRALKESGVSDAAIEGLLINIQIHLSQLQKFSQNEVERLLSEHQKTP